VRFALFRKKQMELSLIMDASITGDANWLIIFVKQRLQIYKVQRNTLLRASRQPGIEFDHG
jgi:hypothetical protein